MGNTIETNNKQKIRSSSDDTTPYFWGGGEPRQKMVVKFNTATSTNVDKSGHCENTDSESKRISSDKNQQNTPNGGEGHRSLKVDDFDFNLTCLPRTQIPVPNPTYRIILIGRRTLNYCATFGAGKQEYNGNKNKM